MTKKTNKIRHVRPGPDTPPAKYQVGAKVSWEKNRCVVQKVWWSGETWLYEVEGSPNGKHRGLWIHPEEVLIEVISS